MELVRENFRSSWSLEVWNFYGWVETVSFSASTWSSDESMFTI